MIRILLLGRRELRAEYDTAANMRIGLQAVASKNEEYIACDYESLVFKYDHRNKLSITTEFGVDLKCFNVIFQFGWFKTKLLEDMALSVAHYAEHHNIPHTNREALFTRSRSKLSQYVIAALAGINVIPFMVAENAKAMNHWAENQGFPLILKAVAGSRGNYNFLVNSGIEIEQIMHDNSEQCFVVQKFIENDGDYRLIVANDKVQLAIHRKGENGSHLNNTSKGGLGRTVATDNLPTKMLGQAVQISNELKREVGGVDMVIDKNSGLFYFLEANNMPQLSTGSNVSSKLSILHEFLISKVK